MSGEQGAAILKLAQELGALTFGSYTLSSGQESSYYFDGRLLTLHPEGAHLVSQALLPLVLESGARTVGGPTLGADPMVGALVHASHGSAGPLRGFLVRSQAKDHGTGQLIEGHLEAGSRVAVLDDACSTGGSLFHAIAAAEERGLEISYEEAREIVYRMPYPEWKALYQNEASPDQREAFVDSSAKSEAAEQRRTTGAG